MAERAHQSLAKVDHGPLSVSNDSIEKMTHAVRGVFARGRSLSARVALNAGASSPLLIDGPAGTIEPVHDPAADAHIEMHPDDVLRIVNGEMDIRQALLFGELKVLSGAPRAAIRLGDFLSGNDCAPLPAGYLDLPQPTEDRAQARRDFERAGYCLVAGAMSPELRARLRARVVDQATAERQAGLAALGAGECDQRIWNLINKGDVFHELLHNPLIDELVTPILGEHFLLTSYSANITGPGNNAGIMHYDQIYVRPLLHEVTIGVNVAWFLDDVTEANGGTRLMPGSHRARVAPEDPFSTDGTVAAAGPAGTALLFDSRLWHATGKNVADHRRHVLLSYFNRSYMRTQENYFLSVPDEVLQRTSPRVKSLLGFRCTGSLGGVEGPVEGQMVSRPAEPTLEMHATKE